MAWYNTLKMLELTLPDEYSMVAPVCLALLGACIGSFLNVVVYRLPRGLSVQNPPRSYCPTCKAPIPWWLNIPIISWLWLRGKSACCHTSIPVRYWLLEVSCCTLFFVIGWYFTYETLLTQFWLCLWAAGMLALLAMDWEEMVVDVRVALFAAVFGLAAAVMEPQLVDAAAVTPLEGLAWSLGSAIGGYLLFRLVALGGRLMFGKRSRTFSKDEPWLLRQVGDDIVLTVAGKDYAWGEVFPETGSRLVLHAAVEHEHTPEMPPGELTLVEDALLLPSGERCALEQYEKLSGTCRGTTLYREAMGSGDAWLALAIGALCGWQGVVFSLVGGSVIGLAYALLMQIRRGTPMPFGPALILAAYVWLFWGPQLLELYMELAM